jgi:uncharacterized protein with ParB-like and HNH nuclease domain
MNDAHPTIKIRDLAKYQFSVKDYQRGYKWTIQQVLDLLEDINGFKSDNGGFYCLQPLALMCLSKEKKDFEVIDGQQRLTTIFIILSIIDKPHFQLSYQTRTSSMNFLSSIAGLKTKNTLVCDITKEDGIAKAEMEINALWKEYVRNDPEKDNTDNYHFFMAYKTTEAWFAQESDKKKDFLSKFKEHARFIWYVEKNETDAKEVFRNLNSGKIPLTNAELIKAHFIYQMKDSNLDIQTLRQNELATEWDYIEKELHDPRFWYFLNNDTDEDRYETRIDILFGILAGHPPKGSDKLYTYRKFTQSPAPELNWDNVKLCFYQLHEWYDDNDIYHLIGYLIYTGFKEIREIKREASGAGKAEFKKNLAGYIRSHFAKWYEKQEQKKEGGYLKSLEYVDSSEQMKLTLLLYNIELSRTSNAHYRFPFDKLKGQPWTLEHIHAQNADDLDLVVEIRSWVNDIEQLMDDIDHPMNKYETSTVKNSDKQFNKSHKDDFDKIKASLEMHEKENSEKIDHDLTVLVKNFSGYVVEFFDLHSIHNMALLDGSTNSSFGKKPFKEKRNALVEIDKKSWDYSGNVPKAFIPIGTKNVFLKYTSSDVKQMNLWGWKDRSEYFTHIQETLKPYLPADGGSNG